MNVLRLVRATASPPAWIRTLIIIYLDPKSRMLLTFIVRQQRLCRRRKSGTDNGRQKEPAWPSDHAGATPGGPTQREPRSLTRLLLLSLLSVSPRSFRVTSSERAHRFLLRCKTKVSHETDVSRGGKKREQQRMTKRAVCWRDVSPAAHLCSGGTGSNKAQRDSLFILMN